MKMQSKINIRYFFYTLHIIVENLKNPYSNKYFFP